MAERPLIVAHRGASADAPENTLPAFEMAWKQGADAIEGDFHLTKDGQIVCIHDGDTERVARTKLEIKTSSLSDLRRLDVGSWRGDKWAGIGIPTIDEVFATIPRGKKIYIEVKCGPEIVPALLREIDRSGLEDEQIVVISFQAAVIAEVERAASRFKTCWLSGFKQEKDGSVSPSFSKVLSELNGCDADGFSSSYKFIDQRFIRRVQAEGYEYHVWTVDDPEIARRFEEWGALSITTNRPAEIRGALEK